MKQIWELTANRNILLTPSGVRIRLGRDAVEMVPFGSVAVILLSYKNVAPTDACHNVLAYTETGQFYWQIGYEVKGQTPYTTLMKSDEQTAYLYNSVGFYLLVDVVTGRVLRKEIDR